MERLFLYSRQIPRAVINEYVLWQRIYALILYWRSVSGIRRSPRLISFGNVSEQLNNGTVWSLVL